MRTFLTACLLAVPLAAQDGRVVHVRTVYTFADGRQVVVEESGDAPKAAKAKAAAVCAKCGPACQCGPSCSCDAASYDGRCAAAPKIVASAPVAPPVIPYQGPTYYAPPVYSPPMYYAPRYYQPMPVGAGFRFRGPMGGSFGAEVCLPGGA